jgi:hypothetical protein
MDHNFIDHKEILFYTNPSGSLGKPGEVEKKGRNSIGLRLNRV